MTESRFTRKERRSVGALLVAAMVLSAFGLWRESRTREVPASIGDVRWSEEDGQFVADFWSDRRTLSRFASGRYVAEVAVEGVWGDGASRPKPFQVGETTLFHGYESRFFNRSFQTVGRPERMQIFFPWPEGARKNVEIQPHRFALRLLDGEREVCKPLRARLVADSDIQFQKPR